VAGQEQQHVELAMGELDLLTAHEHLTGGRIDGHVAELDRRLLRARGVEAAEHRVNPRHELGGRERLDHVVVGPQPQPDHAVRFLGLGREQDHRHTVAVLVAQPAHHLEAIDSGQHQVEHDQVRTLGRGGVQRLASVGGHPGRVAGAIQVAGDNLGDRRLVVDDEHRAPDMSFHEPDCRSVRTPPRARLQRIHRLFRSGGIRPQTRRSPYPVGRIPLRKFGAAAKAGRKASEPNFPGSNPRRPASS
jgi:hypothetical protein